MERATSPPTERDKRRAAQIARQFIDDEYQATQFLLEAAIIWALREVREELKEDHSTEQAN